MRALYGVQNIRWFWGSGRGSLWYPPKSSTKNLARRWNIGRPVFYLVDIVSPVRSQQPAWASQNELYFDATGVSTWDDRRRSTRSKFYWIIFIEYLWHNFASVCVVICASNFVNSCLGRALEERIFLIDRIAFFFYKFSSLHQLRRSCTGGKMDQSSSWSNRMQRNIVIVKLHFRYS